MITFICIVAIATVLLIYCMYNLDRERKAETQEARRCWFELSQDLINDGLIPNQLSIEEYDKVVKALDRMVEQGAVLPSIRDSYIAMLDDPAFYKLPFESLKLLLLAFDEQHKPNDVCAECNGTFDLGSDYLCPECRSKSE